MVNQLLLEFVNYFDQLSSSIYLSFHVDVHATVTPVAVGLPSIQCATASTTRRETTARGVYPSTTTSHGDMVPPAMPSPASRAAATTMPPAATTM